MNAEGMQLVTGVHRATYALRSLGGGEEGATGRVHPSTRDAFLRTLAFEETGTYFPPGGPLRVLGVPITPDETVDRGVLVVETEQYVTHAASVRTAGLTVDHLGSTRVTVDL